MADATPQQPAAGASAAGTGDGLVQLNNLMAGAEASATKPAATGPTDQERAEVKAMPVRQYLETKVVPLLLQGMQKVVIERPVDPVEFLAKFLWDNNPRKKEEPKKPAEGEAAGANPGEGAAAAAAPAAPAAPPGTAPGAKAS